MTGTQEAAVKRKKEGADLRLRELVLKGYIHKVERKEVKTLNLMNHKKMYCGESVRTSPQIAPAMTARPAAGGMKSFRALRVDK